MDPVFDRALDKLDDDEEIAFVTLLKVSEFRNVLLDQIDQKNKIFVNISALASKKRSRQENTT